MTMIYRTSYHAFRIPDHYLLSELSSYGKAMVKKVKKALGDGDLSDEDMALLGVGCPHYQHVPKSTHLTSPPAHPCVSAYEILRACMNGIYICSLNAALLLLQSLCPPEPRDDWDRIVNSFEREFGYLKTLFRFYALQGTRLN